MKYHLQLRATLLLKEISQIGAYWPGQGTATLAEVQVWSILEDCAFV